MRTETFYLNAFYAMVTAGIVALAHACVRSAPPVTPQQASAVCVVASADHTDVQEQATKLGMSADALAKLICDVSAVAAAAAAAEK